ncbi:MAG: helix-turn-helix domain-containing protein [Ruminococcus sp.]|nr:helix-turn-helix domain-containing protein [Candidatus Apopatosoma intestinale]
MLTEFGKLLRIIRINSGDNSKDMAEKLRLSPSYLSAIENGKRNIPIGLERSLCEQYPLSDSDREKLRQAMMDSSEVIKINLTEFGEKKQQLILAITQDDLSEEAVDKLYNLVFKKKREQIQ